MNQAKKAKISTWSFSNRQNSTKNATHVQMSKLDTLRLRIDLNYMNTKFQNHWTKLRWIFAILRKKLASHEQSPRHDQSISKWQSHTNFMLGQPF
jgi:hypothetical protein